MSAGPDMPGLVVGVLGGTGPQGTGLARRFAAAGLAVIIGSRDAARAAAVAERLGGGVRGDDNAGTARACDLAIIAVPWSGHADTLRSVADELAGKVVVDCVNPLGFDERGPFPLTVAEGSAAQQAQSLLPRSRVVAAFHHLSAAHLNDAEADVDSDVLVLADDREATELVQALAGMVPGVRGVYAGRLRNAGQVEALTANLLAINRRHRISAGLRVTGLPEH